MALLAAGCGGGAGDPDPAGKPRIAVSVAPVAALLGPVLADWAEMDVLLPPGESPHGFSLSPTRMSRLSRSSLLVRVGLGLDRWAADAARSLGDRAPPTVRFAALVSAERVGGDHGHAHGHGGGHAHGASGPDPHLWLDPVLARWFVRAMGDRLAKRFPAHAERIAAAVAERRAELAALDRRYRKRLGAVDAKHLVTAHDAFDRVAKRYGLTVAARLTEGHLAPGGEIKPARLAAAIEAVRRHGLTTIYGEPQLPRAPLATVARETGARIRTLDPLGRPGEGYLSLMRRNLATLVAGQSGAGTRPATGPAR